MNVSAIGTRIAILGTMEKNTTRILVADDDEKIRSGIRLLLHLKGYAVVCVSNGVEALNAINTTSRTEQPFHLLICDINMPYLGGAEVLAELKKNKNDLPVIIISGSTIDRTVRRRLRSDKNIICKPFEPSVLLERVEVILNETERV